MKVYVWKKTIAIGILVSFIWTGMVWATNRKLAFNYTAGGFMGSGTLTFYDQNKKGIAGEIINKNCDFLNPDTLKALGEPASWTTAQTGTSTTFSATSPSENDRMRVLVGYRTGGSNDITAGGAVPLIAAVAVSKTPPVPADVDVFEQTESSEGLFVYTSNKGPIDIKKLADSGEDRSFNGTPVKVVYSTFEGQAYKEWIANNAGPLQTLNGSEYHIFIADKYGNFGGNQYFIVEIEGAQTKIRASGKVMVASQTVGTDSPTLEFYDTKASKFQIVSVAQNINVILPGEKARGNKPTVDLGVFTSLLKRLGIIYVSEGEAAWSFMVKNFNVVFTEGGKPLDGLVQSGQLFLEDGRVIPYVETGQKDAKGHYLSLAQIDNNILVGLDSEMVDIQTLLTNSAYAEMAKDILSSGDLIATRVVTIKGCVLKKQSMLSGASAGILDILEASKQFLKIDPSTLTSEHYDLEVRDGVLQLVPRKAQ